MKNKTIVIIFGVHVNIFKLSKCSVLSYRLVSLTLVSLSCNETCIHLIIHLEIRNLQKIEKFIENFIHHDDIQT